jgi:metal-responsive CopG/Arc/MetJ family transcriptional regulator
VRKHIRVPRPLRPIGRNIKLRRGAGYTHDMKTAISVPDRIFRAAERHALRAKKSRSQLYAEAVAEYLARHAPDEVTEAMNRVADEIETRADAFVASAAHQTFERVDW